MRRCAAASVCFLLLVAAQGALAGLIIENDNSDLCNSNLKECTQRCPLPQSFLFQCNSGGTFSKPYSDCKCTTPPPAGVNTDGSEWYPVWCCVCFTACLTGSYLPCNQKVTAVCSSMSLLAGVWLMGLDCSVCASLVPPSSAGAGLDTMPVQVLLCLRHGIMTVQLLVFVRHDIMTFPILPSSPPVNCSLHMADGAVAGCRGLPGQQLAV